eukprot:jgi/Hompol1/225/HPOL_000680-RA
MAQVERSNGSDAERQLMAQAVQLAWLAPQAPGAYSVGAVLVSAAGNVLATGFSREHPGNTHAEQVCLQKLQAATNADPDAARGATIYSTMEPCGLRLSGNEPCASRLITAGIAHVFIGVLEPTTLVAHTAGLQMLLDAGIRVTLLEGFQGEC